ncbi:MAG: helix-turn-helix domain-containing protein, partial [Bacilli bacterium]
MNPTNEKIRMLRQRLNCSQADFIEDICSTTYYSRIENGSLKPSKPFLSDLAIRYHIPIKWFQSDLDEQSILEIKSIVDQFLATDELSGIHLLIFEMNAPHIYEDDIRLYVYGALIHYYLIHHNLSEAKRIVRSSMRT